MGTIHQLKMLATRLLMTHTLKIMKVRMRYHLELNLGKTVSPRRVIRRSFLTYQKMTLMMRKMKFLCKRT